MSHELCEAFETVSLPLCRPLVDMLHEHSSHRTERRGCGFTQASRFLAALVNQPADPVNAWDLAVFSGWPQRSVRQLARSLVNHGWSQGWRNLHLLPQPLTRQFQSSALFNQLHSLLPRLEMVSGQLVLPESRLFLRLLSSVLQRNCNRAAVVNGMREKPRIGSCSQAEEFFLEIAHGRIRRGGQVNIIAAGDGRPAMVEKINLGESHSAVVLEPLNIFGVEIPAGSLCALDYPAAAEHRPTPSGQLVWLSDISEARFLRFTTLAVDPADRHRAFSQQVDTQIRAQMMSPTTTTIEQLRSFAHRELL
ncbi:hypothetical protein F6455_07310 [Proteobacteria bacterium 005FR1]|nr:hypothetical protein [Proteobacteria bacterium 005FR1]